MLVGSELGWLVGTIDGALDGVPEGMRLTLGDALGS